MQFGPNIVEERDNTGDLSGNSVVKKSQITACVTFKTIHAFKSKQSSIPIT